MISARARAHSAGPMDVSMSVSGKLVSSRVEVLTLALMDNKNQAFGKMERKSNGLTRMTTQNTEFDSINKNR